MYDHDKHGYQCFTNDLVRITMIIQKNHNMSWAYDHDKDYYPNDLDQFFAHDIDDCYEPDHCNHDYDDHYDHDVWSYEPDDHGDHCDLDYGDHYESHDNESYWLFWPWWLFCCNGLGRG